jgi:hypothetical protein
MPSPASSWTVFWTDNPSGQVDLGEEIADRLCSQTGIVKRTCAYCTPSHQEIYYKRLTSVSGFSFYNNLVQVWASEFYGSNLLGVDFQLFGSLNDLITNQNAWAICNYDDFGLHIGAFRDCGPTEYVIFQWSTATPWLGPFSPQSPRPWGPITYAALDPSLPAGTLICRRDEICLHYLAKHAYLFYFGIIQTSLDSFSKFAGTLACSACAPGTYASSTGLIAHVWILLCT